MEILKIHEQGFNAKGEAYPMYQTQTYNIESLKEGEVPKGVGSCTLVNDTKLKVGEAVIFQPHYICNMTQPPLPLVITEILEERPAKGNHKEGCIFYSINFKFGN